MGTTAYYWIEIACIIKYVRYIFMNINEKICRIIGIITMAN